MQMMMHQKQMVLAIQGQRQGLLGRAADAEARRRLSLAALALERYRGRHGAYPDTLEKLVPEFLKSSPNDFMDGKPLRYRPSADGRFLLYSVGLDCIDDGGKIARADPRRPAFQMVAPTGGDLVWPLPASAAEAAAFTDAKKQEIEDRIQAALEAEKEVAIEAEARRKATIAALLAQIENPAGPAAKSGIKEPDYHGKPLSQVIGNKAVLGNTNHSLDELLTVKQIITGQEPDVATFELPVSYDVLTNIGELNLLVDAPLQESDDDYEGAGEAQECARATNGDCLLVWNTTSDPPGQHVARARLECTEKPGQNTYRSSRPARPLLFEQSLPVRSSL